MTADPTDDPPGRSRTALLDALHRHFRPEAIADWLERPNPIFDGKRPSELIQANDLGPLWRMVDELDLGTYA